MAAECVMLSWAPRMTICLCPKCPGSYWFSKLENAFLPVWTKILKSFMFHSLFPPDFTKRSYDFILWGFLLPPEVTILGWSLWGWGVWSKGDVGFQAGPPQFRAVALPPDPPPCTLVGGVSSWGYHLGSHGAYCCARKERQRSKTTYKKTCANTF